MAAQTYKIPGSSLVPTLQKLYRWVSSAKEKDEEKGLEGNEPEVRVHICNDLFEASFLKMVLVDENIPFRVEGYEFNPYGSVLAAQHGLCTIIVCEADVPRSMLVIKEALAAVSSSADR
jgi:hypothetical protein